MKFEQFDPQNKIINEVKMSTSVYDQFLASGEAEGIQAGFEAELMFRGVAAQSQKGGTDYDAEPEMDESENHRPNDIDDVIEFFGGGGSQNGRRDLATLRESLQEAFAEWRSKQQNDNWPRYEEEKVKEYIEENDWDEEQELRTYMEDSMELTEEAIEDAMSWYGARNKSVTSSKQQAELKRTDQAYTNYTEATDAIAELLDEKVEESINDRDRNYERAHEEFLDDDDDDDYSEREWIRNEYRDMTDIYRTEDINWPSWTYPELELESGFSEDSAKDLANSLSEELGVNTKVADGYHSTTRKPGLWIFEPDSSLEPDDDEDMPVEIISPPMPLSVCLDTLPKFFAWANSQDAYSNDSTGFHIGVSLPIVGGNVDYLKLALFLGDQYVLDQFERGSNIFTKSAMEKLRVNIEANKTTPEQVANTMKLMKANLIELANKTLGQSNGHGKYTSINLKDNYIEFRSMGSESYFNNPDSLAKVLDTVKRYAYAMYISSHPEMYRDEYAKKLYKLLDTTSNSSAAIQDFANYVTAVGGADQASVKAFIKDIQSGGYKDAPLPDRTTPARSGPKEGKRYLWNVQHDGQRVEVVATTKDEAIAIAKKENPEWATSTPNSFLVYRLID